MVVRTGRTSGLAAREAQHFNDPVFDDFRFQVEYRTDVYEEQRGLEQILYDRYPARLVNGGFNKIRPIGPANYDKLANYIVTGQGFEVLGDNSLAVAWRQRLLAWLCARRGTVVTSA